MTPPEIDFQYTVRFQLRGSSNGEDKSLREYPRYWRELGRFAYLLDDMRTATICNDKLRPKNPLPANPVTLALFYQYKSFDRLTNVVDFNNNCVVYVHGTRAGKIVTGSCDSVERNGRIVKKNGWSDPTNVQKCRVAIRTLHNSFCLEDMSLAYIGTCEKCIKKMKQKVKLTGPVRKTGSSSTVGDVCILAYVHVAVQRTTNSAFQCLTGSRTICARTITSVVRYI